MWCLRACVCVCVYCAQVAPDGIKFEALGLLEVKLDRTGAAQLGAFVVKAASLRSLETATTASKFNVLGYVGTIRHSTGAGGCRAVVTNTHHPHLRAPCKRDLLVVMLPVRILLSCLFVGMGAMAVSYTHLTLPTIYSV